MFARIKPTNHIIKRMIGAQDNRYEATFQSCDLYLPGKRHPTEYEHRIDADKSNQLDATKYYFIGGSTLGQDRYGRLEVNRYEVQLFPEEEVYAHFKSVSSGNAQSKG